MIADQPGMGDELTGIADRAEPLIVEIVGQSVGGQRRDFGRSAARRRPRSCREGRAEAVAAEMLRAIRVRQPSERLELEVGRGDAAWRGRRRSSGTGS